ncbi:MAG: DNA cytosine methyltransferase [Actinomycetota bacterium]|nr:DNA cytosine methyltransferase [Actinomycetota bacterium]
MKMIDLFAGCGGITRGFEDEGFVPVYAVEWEPQAAATYEENFGPHVVADDITEIPDSDFPAADIVVGGPPCQGFSQLGTRDPDDERNVLWKEYARVVAHVQPRVFVLENVPQFLKSGQYGLMQDWTSEGELLEGYELVAGVLNAADFGVPQRRRRAILIGSRVGTPTLPVPTHSRDGLPSWNGLKDALAGIPFESGPSMLPDRRRDDGIAGPFKAEELHLSRHPRDFSLLRYDAVPPGGGRFDLPDELLPACWANKPTGTTDVMGRLEWDKPALTIRTEFYKPEKGRYLHPQYDVDDPKNRVNRPITHWEAARIQTFPDDFKWCGTKIEIARQIGNAVPPILAAALARHLRVTLLDP